MRFPRSPRHRMRWITVGLLWGTVAWRIKTAPLSRALDSERALLWLWYLIMGLTASLLINMLIGVAVAFVSHGQGEEFHPTPFYRLVGLLIGILGGWILSQSPFDMTGLTHLVGTLFGAVVGWITIHQLHAER